MRSTVVQGGWITYDRKKLPGHNLRLISMAPDDILEHMVDIAFLSFVFVACSQCVLADTRESLHTPSLTSHQSVLHVM